MNPRKIFGFVVAVGATIAGVLYFGAMRTSGGVDPNSRERVLLDDAIRAVWGDRDPASIESIKLTSTLTPAGPGTGKPTYELETWVARGDRYREVRTWRDFGITEVFAQHGSTSWASVDSTVVPLDEAEQEQRRLQPWLFQVSKLVPLRDATKFSLEHRGSLRLDDGSKVERLEVEPREVEGLTLTFDFLADSFLLRQVTLDNSRADEELTLALGDYRSVEGIRMAHCIESRRDGEPVARQVVTSVEFNLTMSDAAFRPPVDLNRDAVIEKQSISGLMAWAEHEGDLDTLSDTVDELKDWIAASGAEIIGPLMLLTSEPEAAAGPAKRRRTVCIAVRRPDPGRKLAEREGFGLRRLDSRRSLCMTHVGELTSDAIVAQLEQAAADRGLRRAGAALEIYFSPDRRTRQVQIPVD